MTHSWLKTAAATALLVCAGLAPRAVGESKLTIEQAAAPQYENPYAKQGQSPPAMPTASPYPSTGSTLTITTPAPGLPSVPQRSSPRPATKPDPIVTPPKAPASPVIAAMPPASEAIAAPVTEPAVEVPPPQPVEIRPQIEAAEEAPPVAEVEVLPAEALPSAVEEPRLELPAADLPLAAPAEPQFDAVAPPAEPTRSQAEIDAAMESFWSDAPQVQPADTTPLPDLTSDMPYTPTVAELSQQLLPSVRRAYALAQRGAIFAAQAEFIEILQRIAQAKDAEEGGVEHSTALAAGLRALDEADDFMPGGVQLEAEMNFAVIASSHRTPIADESAPKSPREAIAIYHRYAQQQLGQSVSDDRAGSMALYGLGKIYNRLANESDGDLRHQRKALAMFRASLAAGPANHLAANEIGVLLAKSGHPAEAAVMFRHAIDLAPTSTGYHNLATVERKQGMFDQSLANAQYAEQLSARDRAAGAASRRKGITWVAPQDLQQSVPAPQMPPAPAMNPMANNTIPARSPAVRTMPRGPSSGGTGEPRTVAEWPQKILPGGFRR